MTYFHVEVWKGSGMWDKEIENTEKRKGNGCLRSVKLRWAVEQDVSPFKGLQNIPILVMSAGCDRPPIRERKKTMVWDMETGRLPLPTDPTLRPEFDKVCLNEPFTSLCLCSLSGR